MCCAGQGTRSASLEVESGVARALVLFICESQARVATAKLEQQRFCMTGDHPRENVHSNAPEFCLNALRLPSSPPEPAGVRGKKVAASHLRLAAARSFVGTSSGAR